MESFGVIDMSLEPFLVDYDTRRDVENVSDISSIVDEILRESNGCV